MIEKLQKRPILYGKVCILVVGVLTLIVGLDSHFQSAWWKSKFNYVAHNIVLHPYELCQVKTFVKFDFEKYSCPSISMEKYFIAMIIICFILSVVSLCGEFIAYLKSLPMFKYVDVGFHGISSLLICIAGVVYIVSTNQIYAIITGGGWRFEDDLNFRRSEKLAGGALAIIQSFLYVILAVLIARA